MQVRNDAQIISVKFIYNGTDDLFLDFLKSLILYYIKESGKEKKL